MEDTFTFQEKQDFVLGFLSDLAYITGNGEQIQTLNQTEYNFYITMSLLQEVVDGRGFFWFFLKSGTFFDDLEKAFTAIGSSEAAAICRCALDALGGNIPSDINARKKMLNTMEWSERWKIWQVFDQCDRSFMHLERTLIELSYAFFMKNRRCTSQSPELQPKKAAAPNPFRDKPYIFRCSGIRVYNEYGNPYETVEIYLDMEPEFIGIKSLISEHGPDGITSWHGVFLDAQNSHKLMHLVGKDIEAYLRAFFRKYSSKGLLAFTDFLEHSGIAYESKYAF